MRGVTAWVGLTVLAVFLPATAGLGDEGGADALDRAVARLLPEGWVAERRAIAHLERLVPGTRAYFCRLPARGGYPYETLLVGGKGEALARSGAAVLMARAEAAHVVLRLEPAGWTAQGAQAAAALPLLAAFAERAPGAGRDPGGALTATLVLLELLTWKGAFVSASVRHAAGGGLLVAVDWRQGDALWSFEERSRWTVRFDRGGALREVEKRRESFEKHLRK